ncbi:MAG: hypothetical protein C4542_02030 [Dehalococcoidia bacterium]|nr:MAG: hypothetical protein C4542_02030 [Dehalococcoidia bacterium]
MNLIPIALLKPHPKNKEYFPDALPESLWQELVNDIKEEGIINPLIATTDYTVLAGHLRLEAAKQAGLTHVPVVIRDVSADSDEAVELLIKDNLLRRQLSDMQAARLVRVLKEKYGVKHGGYREPKMEKDDGSKRQNVVLKIADVVGMTERQVQRCDKLNDLVPEFQTLVSSGKLGSTAAYELAFLSSETQRQLLDAYGESITGLKQSEAKGLRAGIEAEIRAESERQISGLKEAVARLTEQKDELQIAGGEQERELRKAITDMQEQLRESLPVDKASVLQEELSEKERELVFAQQRASEAENKYRAEANILKKRVKELEEQKLPQPEVIEKIVEKVVYRADPVLGAELEEARNRAASLSQERNFFQERMRDMATDGERKEVKLRELKERVEELERREEILKKSLTRKENRPKSDPAQEEMMSLMKKAREAAIDLSETLSLMLQKYSKEILFITQRKTASDLHDAVDVIAGATSFNLFEVSLETLAMRMGQCFELLESKKPALRVLKGGEKIDGKEKP